MASDQILIAGQDAVDIVANYAYPATTYVFQAKSGKVTVHLIWSTSAITPSSTVLAKAPNGSICFDLASKAIWMKSAGTVGGIDGVWAYSATLT